jgi:DNA-binding transcriptional ArsR family regulator
MSSSSETQRDTIRDATRLRAIAHPARMAALQHLMKIGPATATDLAEIAGLTPSAMSYHLRNLERAGLIETAEGRGDGRERLWRRVHSGYEIESLDDGTVETREMSRQLLEALIAYQDVEMRRWLSRSDEPGWLDAGVFLESGLMITDAEMMELGQQIGALLKPYGRESRTEPPPDARGTLVFVRAFPIDDPLRKRDVK